jgi:hypothetical protein
MTDYDIRPFGPCFEVLRLKPLSGARNKVERVGLFATRDKALAEVLFQRSMDEDKKRDRSQP